MKDFCTPGVFHDLTICRRNGRSKLSVEVTDLVHLFDACGWPHERNNQKGTGPGPASNTKAFTPPFPLPILTHPMYMFLPQITVF